MKVSLVLIQILGLVPSGLCAQEPSQAPVLRSLSSTTPTHSFFFFSVTVSASTPVTTRGPRAANARIIAAGEIHAVQKG